MFKSYIIYYSFILLTFFVGCSSYNDETHEATFTGEIKDTNSWYADTDENVNVLEMRVTIPRPNEYECTPHNNHNLSKRPCTIADIDGDDDAGDDYRPVLHVQMETDDFISSNEIMNADFKQKGKSTRHAKLKSYRIKLNSKDPKDLYLHERSFQLNKHPNDYSRVRNKLSFDIFKQIPNFISLKTQFMNLKITTTDDNGTTKEHDYGLFTHIESVGEEFLRNRGWNMDDHIYKTQNFDFRMQDALKLDSSGKPLDSEAFDAVIEPKNGKDYSKLIEMLKAINATDKYTIEGGEFDKVFNKYFNRENYITWMAINIVVANKDTVSQNFYLYNPVDSDTFYFIPWDYDGTARDTKYYAKWELSIGTWWGIPLHQRFLNIKKNRDDLDKMVDKLREQYITPKIIQEKLDVYEPLIISHLSQSPDVDVLPLKEWREEFNSLIPRLDENIKNYKDEIEKGVPMPFWQSYKYKDGILSLNWEEAIDFEGDEIVYDIYCADNVDFNNSLVYETNLSVKDSKLTKTSWGEIEFITQAKVNVGDRLFMKVVAKEKNNPNNFQLSFDKEVKIGRVDYFGVLEFVVEN